MTKLETKHIRTDGGTQARAGLNMEKVNEYKELLHHSEGQWPFKDPITVYYDGSDYWLADGFHRVHACWTGGRFVVEAEIRQGTRRDAQLHAAGANAEHGLPRTADDKRRAVTLLLEDEEWGKWSDREIARRCKVSPTFVGGIRKELGDTVHNGQYEERIFVHPKTGAPVTMNTANIAQTQINKAAQRRKEGRGGLTKFEYTKKLVPELVEFLRTYEDKHGRGWRQMQSVAAHTNSTPWQDITREWKRRQIYYEDELLKDAIKLAFDVLNSEQTAVSPDACPDCGSTATKRHPDGSLYCYICTSLVSAPTEEDDAYNYADELQKQIEAAETAVAPPPLGTFNSVADALTSPATEEALSNNGSSVVVFATRSLLDSLKSTEWLIEEMMIQAKAPSPLFYALNKAVMAVRDAIQVAEAAEVRAAEKEAS